MALAEKTCKLAGWASDPLICPFLEKSAELNLGVVVFGGLAGGLLQPIYARLNPDRPNPPVGHFLWGALLGLAAAGISVYVIANSETGDPVRLLFFSLLCGLAFPSILAQAVDGMGKRTKDAMDGVTRAARQAESDDLATTARAANQLKNAMASHPAAELSSQGAPGVDATAQIAVQNIAATANGNPAAAPKVINELQQVGAVAKTAGYDGTAAAAAEALTQLGDASGDDALKTLAHDAAAGLRGG